MPSRNPRVLAASTLQLSNVHATPARGGLRVTVLAVVAFVVVTSSSLSFLLSFA